MLGTNQTIKQKFVWLLSGFYVRDRLIISQSKQRAILCAALMNLIGAFIMPKFNACFHRFGTYDMVKLLSKAYCVITIGHIKSDEKE